MKTRFFSFGFIMLISGFVLFAYIRNNREIDGNVCKGHLAYVAYALQNYYDINSSLPPQKLVNKKGEDVCGWRVILLSAIPDYVHIYNSYDFNSSWDSEQNLKLAQSMPSFFQCPEFQKKYPYNHCNYIWTYNEVAVRQKTEILNDSGILVVEVSGPGTLWTKPDQLTLTQIALAPSLLDVPDLNGPGIITQKFKSIKLNNENKKNNFITSIKDW